MPEPGGLDRRTQLLLIAMLLALVGVSAYRYWLAPVPGPYAVLSGRTMGTTWEVKIASQTFPPEEQRRVAGEVQAALDQVNALMSTYDPDSELSRFNAQRGASPFALSRETIAVLGTAQKISALSSGAFDVTVRPLVNAWGFGATDRLPEPPDAEEIAALRARVGYQKLTLDPDAGTLAKSDPHMEIDLSAIAKGFGVDRVAETLQLLGHEAFLVEVGGELRASGQKLDGTPWRVAIERPEDDRRVIHAVVELSYNSMATSGDYRNFYLEDGQRISHTMDPRETAPIRHRLASVTVVHSSAMWADGLATALHVLGPDAGFALAEERGLAAYFIVREGSEEEAGDGATAFSSRMTSAFEPLILHDPEAVSER